MQSDQKINEDKSSEVLSDWGEFRVINELVLPILSHSQRTPPLGDDCAYVNLPGSPNDFLVVTTDATPKPLAWELGHHCYDTWGWYSVLINASDLAAAGALPLAFSTSVEAPPDTYVHDFRDFFSGINSACKEMRIPNAGGNIRAAPRFESHGTAIGIVPKTQKIDRAGCRPGDRLFIIGECGRFICSFLKARRLGIHKLTSEDKLSLLRPMPQLHAMNILRQDGVVRAASDNSDGILGAIWNIAERSCCGIEVNLDKTLIPVPVAETAASENINPWNLMFFWGDWQVIVAIAIEDSDRFKELTRINGIQTTLIGQAVADRPIIYGLTHGKRRVMNLLRQENFRANSYNANIDEQIRFMLRSNLFVEIETV